MDLFSCLFGEVFGLILEGKCAKTLPVEGLLCIFFCLAVLFLRHRPGIGGGPNVSSNFLPSQVLIKTGLGSLQLLCVR